MRTPINKGQLSLVALYGAKRDRYPGLWRLIQELQNTLVASLGADDFCAYDERRIHATIVGLEAVHAHGEVLNKNYYDMHGLRRPMDIAGLLRYLLETDETLPLRIKIGGYQSTLDYGFTSRNCHPYHRSFSIQTANAVIMGWPFRNGRYTDDLDRLRRRCNDFNILHKYHDQDAAYDNDLFLVLGNLQPGVARQRLEACQQQMREILAHSELPMLEINADELSLIAYPEGDTRFMQAESMTLQEALRQIDRLE